MQSIFPVNVLLESTSILKIYRDDFSISNSIVHVLFINKSCNNRIFYPILQGKVNEVLSPLLYNFIFKGFFNIFDDFQHDFLYLPNNNLIFPKRNDNLYLIFLF